MENSNGKHSIGVEKTNPRPETRVTVMLVSPSHQDWSSLRGMFEHTNWALIHAQDYTQATAILTQQRIPVVITEPRLGPDKTWRNLLAFSPPNGGPRIIVAANSQDDNLWAEVLNLGGYDVLMKPFDNSEVIRVVSLAWLNWRDELSSAKYFNPAVTPSDTRISHPLR